ncbi:MAG: DUF928 domain-containing protein [Coleofasciculus sp. C1-SOL-03]|jgi:hypothetical protein|uniref:DUF928 domain-containing protein n=1 Tax=Coleofasciculus sp. C1-SOL-03 TaxID=3069522 RepID=UPI0032FC685B
MIALKLALILAITVLELTSHRPFVQAHPIQELADIKQDPPLDDRPPDRKPAGTRGPCEPTDQPFTPLLPITDSDFKFSGFTLKAYPTFWFYIPYQSNTINRGAFFLRDLQQGTRTYQVSFQLPETPGFVKISLPITARPLELNKQYSWQFTLYCASNDPTDFSQIVWHQGLIERLDPQRLETKTATALVLDRMEFYRDNRLWYDISADLVQIYDFPLAWRYLLRTLDLEELKKEPIAGSVQPIGDIREQETGNREQ